MYTYTLKTTLPSEHYYIGSTTNLKRRLEEHNSGKCPHTSKYKPWKIKTAIWFDTPEKATAFERYLKSGSGRAFAKKHF
jgi:putative endonuclease